MMPRTRVPSSQLHDMNVAQCPVGADFFSLASDHDA
jgi:hypothetical protein